MGNIFLTLKCGKQETEDRIQETGEDGRWKIEGGRIQEIDMSNELSFFS